MTDSDVLLFDLKKLLGRLETDIGDRSAEVPALSDALRAAYNNAPQAERTALPFEMWRDVQIYPPSGGPDSLATDACRHAHDHHVG